MADEVTGVESCRPCSGTWYQGREGTDCSKAGITLQTLPVLPGFYRHSFTSQVRATPYGARFSHPLILLDAYPQRL